MATGETRPRIDDPEAVKTEWLDRLNVLVGEVEGWARASGWRTRRIDKTVNERDLKDRIRKSVGHLVPFKQN